MTDIHFPELRENIVVGQMYGPGMVTVPPSIRAAAASLGLTPPPVHRVAKTKTKGPAGPVIDAETIRFLIVGLVSGVPEVQRYIVDHYTVPDVELINVMCATRGREDFFNAYRTSTLTFNYHVTIRDIIIEQCDPDTDSLRCKAAVWIDLKIKPWHASFMRRAPLTSVIILYFSVDPTDGRTKCSLQVDHYSMFLKAWCGGVLGQQLQEAIVRPLLGKGVATWGKVMDHTVAGLRTVLKSWTPPVITTRQGHVTRHVHTGQPMFDREPAAALEEDQDIHSTVAAPHTPGGLGQASAGTVHMPVAAKPLGSTAAGTHVSAATKVVPLDLHEDARMRRITAAMATEIIEVTDISGWESRGLLGKTFQATTAVIGVSIALTTTVADMAWNVLQAIFI